LNLCFHWKEHKKSFNIAIVTDASVSRGNINKNQLDLVGKIGISSFVVSHFYSFSYNNKKQSKKIIDTTNS